MGKAPYWRSGGGELIEAGTKVCWLSLDSEDNDSGQLLTYIAFSLFEASLDFPAAGITDDAFFKDVSPRNLLSVLSHIIDVQEERIVLIFDDFESLEESTIGAVIKPFLDYAPPNLHVAIASRDHSKLKVADLDTQGLVGRIQVNNMQFTRDQISTFFDDGLSKHTLNQVCQLTEGWPVAIQMVKNYFESNHNIDHLLNDFNKQSEVLTTYLSEQIFHGLSVKLQTFLMEISLLDRASLEFANFMREENDSASWFKACSPLNALVLPLEQFEDTFHLHPLFREYLYQRLLTTNPDRVSELHRRAAQWFSENGDIVKAVRHCRHAAEPQHAVEIIAQAGGLTLSKGGPGQVASSAQASGRSRCPGRPGTCGHSMPDKR